LTITFQYVPVPIHTSQIECRESTPTLLSVQLSHEAIFQQWVLSTYLQAAITRAPFVELPQMLRLYEGMLAEGTKQAEVSASFNEDLAHSELRNSFMTG